MFRLRVLGLALALTAASVAAAAAPDADSIADAFRLGQVSFQARVRYEGVSQTALRDADALTLRTRFGFTTAPLRGWKVLLEAGNIVAADGDSYSQAGLNPGGAGRAVIADPVGTEIGQAFLSRAQGDTVATIGRQRLVLDAARFVGDAGWRQNAQTFDALVLVNRSLPETTLTYAYIDRVNRVFGRSHSQGRWRSDSHLFNASYGGFSAGTLTGYAYLLDFANSTTNSCATFGARFAGATKLSAKAKLTYHAEFARQGDFGSSPLSYHAGYHSIEAGLAAKPGTLALGEETLGGGNNVGFKTPLASLHGFNGWADVFLTTPAAGLRDIYLKGSALLAEGTIVTAFWHRFETDRGADELGTEFDIQVSRKFGKAVTALVKYADFDRDSATVPEVRKVWLQIEVTY